MIYKIIVVDHAVSMAQKRRVTLVKRLNNVSADFHTHKEAHMRAKAVSVCKYVTRAVVIRIEEFHEATYRNGIKSHP